MLRSPSPSAEQTRDNLIVAKLIYFPDLLANLLELPETVRVAPLGHGNRFLYDFHLSLLVVQVLVQLRLQVEVRPAQNAEGSLLKREMGSARGRGDTYLSPWPLHNIQALYLGGEKMRTRSWVNLIPASIFRDRVSCVMLGL